MERKFEFKYNLLSDEYKLCFEHELSKSEIERIIKEYIIKNNLFWNEVYIIQYGNNIKINFYLAYAFRDKYKIEVNNIYTID